VICSRGKDHITFFEAVFPQYELIAEDMVAEGDKVAVRAVMRGIHKGDFMGPPATDIEVEVPLMLIYRIEDNKIVEHWMQADELGLMMQLGLLPAAEASE
jgi:predicted ester cyclase